MRQRPRNPRATHARATQARATNSRLIEARRTPPAAQRQSALEFSFGDPTPVLDRREIFDYLECVEIGGRYYAPPVQLLGLANVFRAAPHHASAIYCKRNILLDTFIAHPKLSVQDFSQLALDYLVFGNAYLERVRSVMGGAMRYQTALALYVRRGLKAGEFWWLDLGYEEAAMPVGEVFQLREPDLRQEIYGMPEYLAAINSALPNESATLFRRRYYQNGSHAGFIFYMTDAAQDQKDVDNLREAFKNAKGPGNFKNLFLYAPGGKKDGVQLIPVSEVAAKDDFLNIKGVSRDDLLAAHRVPPQLMGIVPNNTGGFGDVEKAAKVFAQNELRPLQRRMREINAWAGEEILRFKDYTLEAAA